MQAAQERAGLVCTHRRLSEQVCSPGAAANGERAAGSGAKPDAASDSGGPHEQAGPPQTPSSEPGKVGWPVKGDGLRKASAGARGGQRPDQAGAPHLRPGTPYARSPNPAERKVPGPSRKPRQHGVSFGAPILPLSPSANSPRDRRACPRAGRAGEPRRRSQEP